MQNDRNEDTGSKATAVSQSGSVCVLGSAGCIGRLKCVEPSDLPRSGTQHCWRLQHTVVVALYHRRAHMCFADGACSVLCACRRVRPAARACCQPRGAGVAATGSRACRMPTRRATGHGTALAQACLLVQLIALCRRREQLR
jgi:hypothetical protein